MSSCFGPRAARARLTSARHTSGLAEGRPKETTQVTAAGSRCRGAGSSVAGSPRRHEARLGARYAGGAQVRTVLYGRTPEPRRGVGGLPLAFGGGAAALAPG